MRAAVHDAVARRAERFREHGVISGGVGGRPAIDERRAGFATAKGGVAGHRLRGVLFQFAVHVFVGQAGGRDRVTEASAVTAVAGSINFCSTLAVVVDMVVDVDATWRESTD